MQLVTSSGAQLNLLAPAHSKITLTDIAHALAILPRWAGATQLPLSIAQHRIMIADQIEPHWRIYALVHNTHKAYLGDMPAPLKQILSHRKADDTLKTIETALNQAIHHTLGLQWPVPAPILTAIQAATQRATATQIRDLLPIGALKISCSPLTRRIKPLPWPVAEAAYLQAIATYLPIASPSFAYSV